MLVITPDTNVLVSATIIRGNEYQLLKAAKLGKIKIVLSPSILKEFKDVISRPKFGFTNKQIENVFRQLLDITDIVVPSIKLDVVKEDPTDNKILECALECKADFVVSGDNHLLEIKSVKGMKIIRAKDFLEIIQSNQ